MGYWTGLWEARVTRSEYPAGLMGWVLSKRGVQPVDVVAGAMLAAEGTVGVRASSAVAAMFDAATAVQGMVYARGVAVEVPEESVLSRSETEKDCAGGEVEGCAWARSDQESSAGVGCTHIGAPAQQRTLSAAQVTRSAASLAAPCLFDRATLGDTHLALVEYKVEAE